MTTRLVSHNHHAKTAAPVDFDKSEVRATLASFVAVLQDPSPRASTSCHTSDAIFVQPGQPPVHGHEDMRKRSVSVLHDVTLEPEHIEGRDGLAHASGRFGCMLEAPTGGWSLGRPTSSWCCARSRMGTGATPTSSSPRRISRPPPTGRPTLRPTCNVLVQRAWGRAQARVNPHGHPCICPLLLMCVPSQGRRPRSGTARPFSPTPRSRHGRCCRRRRPAALARPTTISARFFRWQQAPPPTHARQQPDCRVRVGVGAAGAGGVVESDAGPNSRAWRTAGSRLALSLDPPRGLR